MLNIYPLVGNVKVINKIQEGWVCQSLRDGL